MLLLCPAWFWLLGFCLCAFHVPIHWSDHGQVCLPCIFQHLVFPCRASQRDAFPMVLRGSSSLLPDRVCSGLLLPAGTCLMLQCSTSHPLSGNQNSQLFQSLPSPSVTQTGPAAREQGVKGHTNIWRAVQPFPHPHRGLLKDRQHLGTSGVPRGCASSPLLWPGWGTACWQHSMDTSGPRAPSISTQLAHWPPSHLELLTLDQAAAHRVYVQQQGQDDTLVLCQKAGQAWGKKGETASRRAHCCPHLLSCSNPRASPFFCLADGT